MKRFISPVQDTEKFIQRNETYLKNCKVKAHYLKHAKQHI